MKRPILLMFCALLPFVVFAQQWEAILPDTVSISSGFINEDNTMELVGYSGNYGAYFRVFGDGHYETTTFPAPEGKKLVLQTITPLDNGGCFVSGRIATDLSDMNAGELKIMILDDTRGRRFLGSHRWCRRHGRRRYHRPVENGKEGNAQLSRRLRVKGRVVSLLPIRRQPELSVSVGRTARPDLLHTSNSKPKTYERPV